MTRNESFKRRIRARMATTGERYGAARRVLIDQADRRRRRVWVAEPETSDEAVRTATGRGWDDWCDVIDAWPGRDDGHAAIVAFVRDQAAPHGPDGDGPGIDGWWAQSVTVGYERITGRRLPHQRADGTFSVSRSRTVGVDADELRAMLLDADDRADLFGGLATELRSRPTSKALRVAIGPGVALFAIEPRDHTRTKVTVAHERLPSADDVEHWQHYWSEWLEALAES